MFIVIYEFLVVSVYIKR